METLFDWLQGCKDGEELKVVKVCKTVVEIHAENTAYIIEHLINNCDDTCEPCRKLDRYRIKRTR